jgi:hypothetical protein
MKPIFKVCAPALLAVFAMSFTVASHNGKMGKNLKSTFDCIQSSEFSPGLGSGSTLPNSGSITSCEFYTSQPQSDYDHNTSDCPGTTTACCFQVSSTKTCDGNLFFGVTAVFYLHN